MTRPSELEKTNNITLLPPKYIREAGRPKKSRRRDITEIKNCKGKHVLTRWHSHTCKYCGLRGHNVRTCAKKKAEYEGEGSGVPSRGKTLVPETALGEGSRGETSVPKTTLGEGSAIEEGATENMNQEEVIDPEQAEHEKYLSIYMSG
ncbi:hypothetical protein LIER_38370 [Lithospermum erythrorhizon]|uniref:CCHC-type domain-containing protein n=1 Tax=Lithospermum erythrorhizon TaxID=34254 RepID=A0AAV3Q177_LITER